MKKKIDFENIVKIKKIEILKIFIEVNITTFFFKEKKDIVIYITICIYIFIEKYGQNIKYAIWITQIVKLDNLKWYGRST